MWAIDLFRLDIGGVFGLAYRLWVISLGEFISC